MVLYQPHCDGAGRSVCRRELTRFQNAALQAEALCASKPPKDLLPDEDVF